MLGPTLRLTSLDFNETNLGKSKPVTSPLVSVFALKEKKTKTNIKKIFIF